MDSFWELENKVRQYESYKEFDDPLLRNLTLDPREIRKVVQNNLKKSKDGIQLAQMKKSVLSGISLKRYILNDAINTLPFNHPLLVKYVYPNREDKTDLQILQTDELVKTVKQEENIYYEHRPIYIMKQLYTNGRLKGKRNYEDYIIREKFSNIVIKNAFKLVDNFD